MRNPFCQTSTKRRPQIRGAAKLALIFLAGTVLSGGSCLSVKRSYPPPLAEQVVKSLRKQTDGIQSLRGSARMTHYSDRGKIKATVRFAARKGGELRFDLVSPFDTPLTTLVTQGRKFTLVDAKENRHYYGPAIPCNIARLLQLHLEPDAVRVLLAGSVPLIAHNRATLTWDQRTGEEVLLLFGNERQQELRLAGKPGAWKTLEATVYGPKRSILLRLKASGHQQRQSTYLPKKLSIEQPLYNKQLELSFTNLETNIKLPDVAFKPLPASGLPSQFVDCTTAVRPPTSQ